MRCGRDRTCRRSRRPREGFARRASKYGWMRQASTLPPAPGRSSRAPAYPKTRPRSAAARARGAHRARRARARLAAHPQRVRGGDRDQRQDDDDRVDRPRPPRGRAAGGGRRQRRDRGLVAGRPARRRRHGRVRGVLVPARGHGGVLARGRGPAEPRRPTTSTATATYEDYVAAKLRIFVNQGNYDVAVAPADLGVEDLGGCARRVLFGSGAGPELSDRAGYLWWDEQPIIRVDEIALPGAHNRQNAMATAAACLARGLDAEAVATGLRTFAGVRHRLERSRSRTASPTSTTPRPPTSRARSSRCGRSRAAIHLIAGGRGKQQDFSPLAPLVAERCRAVYLIGEAARRARGRAGPHRRSAAPGGRSRARGRARAARPPSPARSCCSRPRARAMTSTRLRGARRPLPRRSWRRADGSRGGRYAAPATAPATAPAAPAPRSARGRRRAACRRRSSTGSS